MDWLVDIRAGQARKKALVRAHEIKRQHSFEAMQRGLAVYKEEKEKEKERQRLIHIERLKNLKKARRAKRRK